MSKTKLVQNAWTVLVQRRHKRKSAPIEFTKKDFHRIHFYLHHHYSLKISQQSLSTYIMQSREQDQPERKKIK